MLSGVKFRNCDAEEDTVDTSDKDKDKLKKPDLFDDNKDSKDLDVPIFTYSFASPPKEDKKDVLKSLLGRRMF